MWRRGAWIAVRLARAEKVFPHVTEEAVGEAWCWWRKMPPGRHRGPKITFWLERLTTESRVGRPRRFYQRKDAEPPRGKASELGRASRQPDCVGFSENSRANKQQTGLAFTTSCLFAREFSKTPKALPTCRLHLHDSDADRGAWR